MTENEFARQQQAAVERMREMNARSQINQNTEHKMPPVPSFVRINETHSAKSNNSPEKTAMPQQKSRPNQTYKPTINNGIPFLDSILKDADSTLIIGLLLILMSENSDKMMLFALIYILL